MFMNFTIACKYLPIAALLLLLANLGACGSSVQADLAAAPQAQPPATHKPTGAHKAKPGSLVTWVDASPIYIQPGETSTQVLALAVSQEVGQMQVAIVDPATLVDAVRVTDSAPVEVSSQQRQWQFTLTPGGRYELPVELFSPTSGRFHLRVQVKITQGDQVQERQLLRVVQVGAVSQRNQKPVAGDEVISLPAQETITQPANNKAPKGN